MLFLLSFLLRYENKTILRIFIVYDFKFSFILRLFVIFLNSFSIIARVSKLTIAVELLVKVIIQRSAATIPISAVKH